MIPPVSCLPFCILISPLVSRAKETPEPSAHSWFGAFVSMGLATSERVHWLPHTPAAKHLIRHHLHEWRGSLTCDVYSRVCWLHQRGDHPPIPPQLCAATFWELDLTDNTFQPASRVLYGTESWAHTLRSPPLLFAGLSRQILNDSPPPLKVFN